MGKRFICLDIGASKILGAVMNEDNEILCRVKKKTSPELGRESVDRKIIKTVHELMSACGMGIKDLKAIGAGAPGIIDTKHAMVRYAPNLPWQNHALGRMMEEEFQAPFVVGNDVNLGVLGEWKFGVARGCANVVGLFVGTGIGGGIIIDGKLFIGSGYAGAEIGHMIINTDGPLCKCGQTGCLEAHASKVAITRELKAGLAGNTPTVLKDVLSEGSGIIKSSDLKKAIRQGDPLAISTFRRAVYYLSVGIGNLINLFNPEMVILGGGVVEALEKEVLELVSENIGRFAWPAMLSQTQIKASQLKDDAVLYGARALISEILGY
ncbi:ROK family protein [Thermoclostridium caenicola]|uniref:Glucokinase n=1 Tax=Thermoclostridium caenicola TaxID=659425 RepID=A0A1M6DRE0_9FIRM|nr:ROK family protein [Thermoclostridium caenicola]SHI75807.1 glucokinase [Thermoclostridium caenicola]